MRFILILGGVFICISNVHSQEVECRQLVTIADVYHAYPGRRHLFLDQIDWVGKGLEEAEDVYQQGDEIRACEMLLSYYGDKFQAASKVIDTQFNTTRRYDVEAVLDDTYTFYRQKSRVPRLADGHLDWSHEGPTKDIEWAWALNRHLYYIGLKCMLIPKQLRSPDTSISF